MRETKIYCDQCNEDITYAGRILGGRGKTIIVLDSTLRYGIRGYYERMLPIDGPLHFCDKACLLKWVLDDYGRRFDFSEVELPDWIKFNEDNNVTIIGDIGGGKWEMP